MDIDRIAAELIKISSERGSLDRRLVQGARYILGLPRYAASDDPERLLVADLHMILAALPEDRRRSPAPGNESNAVEPRSFREDAAYFFSLKGPGQYRGTRMDGLRRPGGSVNFWRERALSYRVAAGIMERQREAEPGSAPTSKLSRGFEISALTFTRSPGAVGGLLRERLSLDLLVLQPGPHCMRLPWSSVPFRGWPTCDRAVSADGSDLTTSFEIDFFRQPYVLDSNPWLLVLGSSIQSGTNLLIDLSHRVRVIRPPRAPVVEYRVLQPVETLTLVYRHRGERIDQQASWRVVARPSFSRSELAIPAEISQDDVTIKAVVRRPQLDALHAFRPFTA